MNVRAKSLPVANPGVPFLISHHELGWFPEQWGPHQISVNGLDGGTYTVNVRVPGDLTFQEHETGNTETDTVIVDRLTVSAFQIVFADLGEDAEPVVIVGMRPRGGV